MALPTNVRLSHLLLLIGCGALSLACPPEKIFGQMQTAAIPADAESATIVMTAVVPQGDWTLRVHGSGDLTEEVREPSEDVTLREQECFEPCLFNDYVLHCPRGMCTFSFELSAARGAGRTLALSAEFTIHAPTEEGCGDPDPQAVPPEDIGRLFHLTVDVRDVVHAPDAGFGWYDPDAALDSTDLDGGFSMPSTTGTMVDPRDGRQYAIVTLGTQTWFAQNLSFGEVRPSSQVPAQAETVRKLCPNDDPQACDVFGGLYTWTEALALPAVCAETFCAAQLTAPQRGLCPVGWHIPTPQEWNDLLSALLGSEVQLGAEQQAWQRAAPALKSPGSWPDATAETGESLLAALPAGMWNPGSGFAGFGEQAVFHAAAEYDDYSSNGPWLFDLGAFWAAHGKDAAFSVRCLQD